MFVDESLEVFNAWKNILIDNHLYDQQRDQTCKKIRSIFIQQL